MHGLSRERYTRARSAIYEHGRSLDVSLFDHRFEDAAAEDVVEELRQYQNDDGGFGHALEPDFRLEASSPLATSVGLQYAAELELSSGYDLVRAALAYLEESYREREGYWPATYEDVNDAPHAVWWHVDTVTAPSESEWPNPSAELLGYLGRWGDAVSERFLEVVTERAARNVRDTTVVGDDRGRRYAILCWERALPHLPPRLAGDVRTSLERTVRSMDLDEELRELYAFAFAFSPETTVARLYPDRVDRLLDEDIERQARDGGWWPTWGWGQYEDAWPTAEREWVGKLTLECLLTLERFGKLEGGAR